MHRKLSTVLFVLLAFSMMAFAQERPMLRPIGSQLIKKSQLEAIKVPVNNKYQSQQTNKIVPQPKQFANVQGKIDTLSYRKMLGGSWNTNFGMFGQDVMIQWYVAPTTMNIKSIGYAASDNATGTTQMSVKLVKASGWTVDDLENAGVTQWGYYPADGNGYNDIGALPEEATGEWVNLDGGENGPTTFPFAEDLWSDGGLGASTTPVVTTSTNPEYQWVDMMALGFEPEVQGGDIVGIVATNLSADYHGVNDRIGLFAEATDKYWGWKFYRNGRTNDDLTTAGWWSREYIWDMVLAVDLTGDTPPSIENITDLPTVTSTNARTVEATITDDNPSGGDAGVASAVLQYSTDGTNFTDVAMTANGDVYSADIPGQQPGTEVWYKISATDVLGNSSTSLQTFNYTIFLPSKPTLLVFNGYADVSGYPVSYYFGINPDTYEQYDFAHDTWSYGALTEDLVNHYTNIIEIASPSPVVYNDDVIRAWLNADPARNYMLAGQEYLGARNAFRRYGFCCRFI